MTKPKTRRQTWLALSIFTALFVLLFQYRILSLLKKLGAGVSPLGTKFPVAFDLKASSAWLLPVYHTLDYLNAIWFTTILGLFLAGAAAAFLPGLLGRHLHGSAVRQVLAGVLIGLPNMFCTCCAAGTLAGLRRAGATLRTSVAFFVTAPALNLVVIILAFELLPLKLALARLVLGLAAALGVSYAVARFVPGVRETIATPAGRAGESLADMLLNWLRHTRAITKMVLPLLVAGFLAVGVFKTVLPLETIAGSIGDGFLATVLVAVMGSILMVPTFTEVLWVQEFTSQGMGAGPAAALLITLPAISFPSLWVLGNVLGSYRAPAVAGLFILALGIAGGTVFSLV